MKQFILTIATLLIYFSVLAQDMQPNEIKGKRTVKSVQLIADMEFDKDQLKIMEGVKDGFINSKFFFKSDNTFLFEMPNSISSFMEELKFLNNKKWKINTQNGSVMIGSVEDQYSLMSIFVKTQGDKTFFLLDETPLLLEVARE